MTMTQLTANAVTAHSSDPELGALARESFAKTAAGKEIVQSSKQAAVFFFFGNKGDGLNDAVYDALSADVIFDAITLSSRLEFVVDDIEYRMLTADSIFQGNEDSLLAMLLVFQLQMQVGMTGAALRVDEVAIAGLGCSGCKVLDVLVPDYVDYDSPEQCSEWAWIEERSSYAHVKNGRNDGVWEFFLNLAHLEHDLAAGAVNVPSSLSVPIRAALAGGYEYILFHQGT